MIVVKLNSLLTFGFSIFIILLSLLFLLWSVFTWNTTIELMMPAIISFVLGSWLFMVGKILLHAGLNYDWFERKFEKIFTPGDHEKLLNSKTVFKELIYYIKENYLLFGSIILLLYFVGFENKTYVLTFLILSVSSFLIMGLVSSETGWFIKLKIILSTILIGGFIFFLFLQGGELYPFVNALSCLILLLPSIILFKRFNLFKLGKLNKSGQKVRSKSYVLLDVIASLQVSQKILLSDMDGDATRKKAISIIILSIILVATKHPEYLPDILVLITSFFITLFTEGGITTFKPYYIGLIYIGLYSFLTMDNHIELISKFIHNPLHKCLFIAQYVLSGPLLIIFATFMAVKVRDEIDILIVMVIVLFSSWELIPRILSTMTVSIIMAYPISENLYPTILNNNER